MGIHAFINCIYICIKKSFTVWQDTMYIDQ